jgi:hypothetical protein
MTLSGLRLAVRSLLGSKGRKSLILYSEGFIRAPRVEKEEFVGLIDLARKAQVAIYYVDAAGLRTRSRLGPFPQPGKLTAGVEEETGGAIHVALQTGGRTSSSNDATLELRRVLEESTAYYLIGYVPAASGSRERRVEIRARRPGLDVVNRVRRVLPGREASAKKVSWEATALRSVADAPELPMRVTVAFPPADAHRPDVVAPRNRKRADMRAVQVRIEADVGSRGAGKQELLFLTEARARDGGKPVVDSARVVIGGTGSKAVIERRWFLVPGVWQFRVVLREPSSPRIGSALVTFEVGPKG